MGKKKGEVRPPAEIKTPREAKNSLKEITRALRELGTKGGLIFDELNFLGTLLSELQSVSKDKTDEKTAALERFNKVLTLLLEMKEIIQTHKGQVNEKLKGKLEEKRNEIKVLESAGIEVASDDTPAEVVVDAGTSGGEQAGSEAVARPETKSESMEHKLAGLGTYDETTGELKVTLEGEEAKVNLNIEGLVLDFKILQGNEEEFVAGRWHYYKDPDKREEEDYTFYIFYNSKTEGKGKEMKLQFYYGVKTERHPVVSAENLEEKVKEFKATVKGYLETGDSVEEVGKEEKVDDGDDGSEVPEKKKRRNKVEEKKDEKQLIKDWLKKEILPNFQLLSNEKDEKDDEEVYSHYVYRKSSGEYISVKRFLEAMYEMPSVKIAPGLEVSGADLVAALHDSVNYKDGLDKDILRRTLSGKTAAEDLEAGGSVEDQSSVSDITTEETKPTSSDVSASATEPTPDTGEPRQVENMDVGDGLTYSGTVDENNEPHAQGGDWENNKRHGLGKFTHADGTTEEGQWQEGEFVKPKVKETRSVVKEPRATATVVESVEPTVTEPVVEEATEEQQDTEEPTEPKRKKLLDWQKVGDKQFYLGQVVHYQDGGKGFITSLDSQLGLIEVNGDVDSRDVIFANDLKAKLDLSQISQPGTGEMSAEEKATYKGRLDQATERLAKAYKSKDSKFKKMAKVYEFEDALTDYKSLLKESFELVQDNFADYNKFLQVISRQLASKLDNAEAVKEILDDTQADFARSSAYMEKLQAKEAAAATEVQAPQSEAGLPLAETSEPSPTTTAEKSKASSTTPVRTGTRPRVKTRPVSSGGGVRIGGGGGGSSIERPATTEAGTTLTTAESVSKSAPEAETAPTTTVNEGKTVKEAVAQPSGEEAILAEVRDPSTNAQDDESLGSLEEKPVEDKKRPGWFKRQKNNLIAIATTLGIIGAAGVGVHKAHENRDREGEQDPIEEKQEGAELTKEAKEYVRVLEKQQKMFERRMAGFKKNSEANSQELIDSLLQVLPDEIDRIRNGGELSFETLSKIRSDGRYSSIEMMGDVLDKLSPKQQLLLKKFEIPAGDAMVSVIPEGSPVMIVKIDGKEIAEVSNDKDFFLRNGKLGFTSKGGENYPVVVKLNTNGKIEYFDPAGQKIAFK